MTVDYNALTAWGAVAAALVAAVALWMQLQSSRFSRGVDLLLRMDERFNSSEMIAARRRAAKGLLEGTDPRIDAVIDFFEMIGMLVRKRVLDDRMVWHAFFYWFNSYWCLSKDEIEAKRGTDATVWADATYLHGKLVKIEKKERQCSDRDTVPSKESLQEFLNAEVSLLGDRPAAS